MNAENSLFIMTDIKSGRIRHKLQLICGVFRVPYEVNIGVISEVEVTYTSRMACVWNPKQPRFR